MSQYDTITQNDYYIVNNIYRNNRIVNNALATRYYSDDAPDINLLGDAQGWGQKNSVGQPVEQPVTQPRANTSQSQVRRQASSNKNLRQQLNITEGSNGLKFVRIARAIEELQDDIKCPFTQYYNVSTNNCVDNDTVCPAGQRYDIYSGKCIAQELFNVESPVKNQLDSMANQFYNLNDRMSENSSNIENLGQSINRLQSQIDNLQSLISNQPSNAESSSNVQTIPSEYYYYRK